MWCKERTGLADSKAQRRGEESRVLGGWMVGVGLWIPLPCPGNPLWLFHCSLMWLWNPPDHSRHLSVHCLRQQLASAFRWGTTISLTEPWGINAIREPLHGFGLLPLSFFLWRSQLLPVFRLKDLSTRSGSQAPVPAEVTLVSCSSSHFSKLIILAQRDIIKTGNRKKKKKEYHPKHRDSVVKDWIVVGGQDPCKRATFTLSSCHRHLSQAFPLG